MKTYVLTIGYNDETEEIEYLTEEILNEHTAFFMEMWTYQSTGMRKH